MGTLTPLAWGMLPSAHMETQVETTFRNTVADADIEALVRREVARLEGYGTRLVSCRLAIEQPQRSQRDGSRFRVRLTIGAGLRRPIVVKREPSDSEMHESLRTIVLGVFRAARRQVQELNERRRGDTKTAGEERALIVRLFPGGEAAYGFLRAPDGRELYFHRNSVLHEDYDRLTVGTEVRFEEEEGEEGPQASTVQVVGKPRCAGGPVRTRGGGSAAWPGHCRAAPRRPPQ